MEKILSLDLGTKRIGVAVSDSLGMLAHPFDVWAWKSIEYLLEQLKTTIEQQNIKKLVIGVPWTMKGTTSKKTEEVLEIINKLEKSLDLPVIKIDERLTSKMAQDSLKIMGKKPSRNKSKIDQLAAVIILQSYLDQN
jgi:putative Holliday junction resolvase